LYAALDSADRALLVTDAAGAIRYCNTGVSRHLGHSGNELMGRHPAILIAGADPSTLLNKARAGQSDEADAIAIRKDGSRFPVLLSLSAMRDSTGAAAGFLCIFRDLTQQKAEEESRQEAEERFRDLFENASDLIQSIDPTGRFLYVNPAWHNALGYSDAEVAGLTVRQIIHPDHLSEYLEMMGRLLTGEAVGTVETVFVAKDGSEIVLEGKTSCLFRDGKPVYIRGIFRDITHRHWYEQEVDRYRRHLEEANARLEELATTDVLTGLKNRLVFEQRLDEEFRRSARYRIPLALLMIDVDHFKAFNDTFGHPAGDDVLRTVARVLKVNSRLTDLPARYGGEEFVVLLTNTDPEGAVASAERVRRAVEMAAWSERPVTVSVGVANYSHDMVGPMVLVAAADKALYRAKAGGRNRVEQ
jgi:diguanylate cyclase (GGDEF)-like protein/PAS domain S-box-containing protein